MLLLFCLSDSVIFVIAVVFVVVVVDVVEDACLFRRRGARHQAGIAGAAAIQTAAPGGVAAVRLHEMLEYANAALEDTLVQAIVVIVVVVVHFLVGGGGGALLLRADR